MTFLVTGATGNIGSRVAARLVAEGEPVRAAARDRTKINIEGAETVAFDLLDPGDLGGVLDGVRGIFLYPTVGGAPELFLKQAKDAGVDYVVLLSSGDVYEGAPGNPIREAHLIIEDAVETAGIAYTKIYPSWLATNADRDWGHQIRADGRIGLVHPESQYNPIHIDDIAEVTAELLIHRSYPGTMLHLSGPQSLTQTEIINTLAEEIGRELIIDRLTDQQAIDRREDWMPEVILRQLLAYEAGMVGRTAPIDNTVERFTGHPARTFRQWARENADRFPLELG
jgi:uncharacterized protein YbjT (DUF2867 family)